MNAQETGDSAEINKLLADAKAEAVELKTDSTEMESFIRSKLSWQSYASKIEKIKGHVNNTGKLLTQLHDAKASGSPWQQTAIDRIEPLLKEMADNLETTINHLNANQSKVHLPEFRDYVKANHELSADLEALIRDYVEYGKAKDRFEKLSSKLETGG